MSDDKSRVGRHVAGKRLQLRMRGVSDRAGGADMYEAVSSRAMSGDQLPEGCQLHIAGPVEQGWRVITVWDSREMFDRFREEKLLPAVRELAGGEGPPDVEPEVNPVHKLITA